MSGVRGRSGIAGSAIGKREFHGAFRVWLDGCGVPEQKCEMRLQ